MACGLIQLCLSLTVTKAGTTSLRRCLSGDRLPRGRRAGSMAVLIDPAITVSIIERLQQQKNKQDWNCTDVKAVTPLLTPKAVGPELAQLEPIGTGHHRHLRRQTQSANRSNILVSKPLISVKFNIMGPPPHTAEGTYREAEVR